LGYTKSVILGQGVLSNQQMDEWARQRALLKPAFSSNALKELLPVIKKGLEGFLDLLEDFCKQGKPFDIHEELNVFAFLTIGHSALGEEDSFLTRRAKALRDAFTTASMKEIGRADLNSDEEYMKAKKEIEAFTSEAFSRQETNPSPRKNSLISVVLGKDAKGCPHLNAQQRKDELSTFMFAGLVFLISLYLPFPFFFFFLFLIFLP